MKKTPTVVFLVFASLAILTSACKQGEVWALQSPIVVVPKNGQSAQVQTSNPPPQATKAWKGVVVNSQPNHSGTGFIIKVKISDTLSPQYLNDVDIVSGTDVEVITEALASDPSKTRIVVRPLVSNTLPPPPTK